MSHRSRVGWIIAGVSLLVLIISALATKFSLGLLRDLGGMAFLGIPLGVAGLITGIIIAVHERGEVRHETGTIDDLHSGEGVLVHWSYTPEEWNGFVAKVIAQRKKDLPWKVLLIPVPMVGFLWLLFGEVTPVIFIPFAVGVIWMMIYLPSRTLAKLGRGDVIISRNGALIHDRWYDWSYGNRLLTGVVYEEGNPASISFKWVRVGGGAWGTFSPTDVSVPVPHGHKKEAAHLISTLSPNAKQQGDRPGRLESIQPSIDRSVPPPLPPSSRPWFNALVELMADTGIAVTVLALAAAFGEGSWAILGVAVSLIIFEVCAVFWGPSGGLAFALQALIQLALFSTFLYAALTHNRDHGYFSSEKSHYQHDQKTPEEARALTASYEARKELDSGHSDQALRLFDEAIRLDPKHADRYYERGGAYAQLGQTQRAIQDFDEAIRLQPTEPLYYALRGHAYDDLGKSQRAIEDFDRAIRLDAKCAPAYNYRGLVYVKLGQIQRAILDYDQAIGLYPTYAPYYEDRGKAYQALGNAKQAQRDFDKAKELKAKK